MENIIACSCCVRSYQTSYYKTKSHSDLIECKRTEKKLDDLLEQYFHGGEGPQHEQQKLFPDAP